MKHKGQAIYNQLIGKFKTRQKIGRVLLKQSSYDSPVHKSTHNSVTRREKGAKDHKSVECTPRRPQDTDGGLVNNRHMLASIPPNRYSQHHTTEVGTSLY